MSKQTFSGIFADALKTLYPNRIHNMNMIDGVMVIKATKLDGSYVGFSIRPVDNVVSISAITYNKQDGADTTTISSLVDRNMTNAHKAIILGIGLFNNSDLDDK